MPQPTDELTIRLTVAEWNVVFELVGTGQYRQVADLIAKMRTQAEDQTQEIARTRRLAPVE